jgi:hypothetical protein
MGSLKKGMALVLILMVAFSTLSLLNVKPVNAQTVTSTPTSAQSLTNETGTFSYKLSNYTVIYEITSSSKGYLIGLLVMDNPPIEINFTEQLSNGTEIEVTKYIAYGMTIPSTSYPMNITFTELSNNPTATPSSTTSQTPNPSPSVPEFPTLTFLLLVLISLSCILFTKKHPLKKCIH